MRKALRRLAVTTAAVGMLAAGTAVAATPASAQSYGDFNQALSDVNSGDAFTVDISDRGIYRDYQIGYGDFFGTFYVESYTLNTITWGYSYGGGGYTNWDDYVDWLPY